MKIISEVKKTILFIHQGRGIGGASLCLKELLDEIKDEYKINILCIYESDAADYFKRSGYQTDVLTSFFYRKFYTYFYHSEAYEYTYSKPYKIIKSIISYVLNIFIARKIIKSYHPSLIHLNSSVLSDWAIASKKCGYKVVIHIREPMAKGWFGIRRNILRFIIRKYTDHIIAISKDNAFRLNLLEKTTIIYDPIRTLSITSLPDTDKNFKYFIYLGGTQSIKGFNVIVEALPFLQDDIKIFFAGEIQKYQPSSGKINKIKHYIKWVTPSFRRRKNNISHLEKSNKAIILGHINNINNYIIVSMALLFPSTRPHFADPIMESYKIGKPVIASDVAGMDEIVNSNTGMLFKKNNPKELADKINAFSKLNNIRLDDYYRCCLQKYQEIYSNNNKINDVFTNTINI